MAAPAELYSCSGTKDTVFLLCCHCLPSMRWSVWSSAETGGEVVQLSHANDAQLAGILMVRRTRESLRHCFMNDSTDLRALVLSVRTFPGGGRRDLLHGRARRHCSELAAPATRRAIAPMLSHIRASHCRTLALAQPPNALAQCSRTVLSHSVLAQCSRTMLSHSRPTLSHNALVQCSRTMLSHSRTTLSHNALAQCSRTVFSHNALAQCSRTAAQRSRTMLSYSTVLSHSVLAQCEPSPPCSRTVAHCSLTVFSHNASHRTMLSSHNSVAQRSRPIAQRWQPSPNVLHHTCAGS